MQKALDMKVENLDHLGLIAGLVDAIGIVQKINELVGLQPAGLFHSKQLLQNV
ncbi:DUF4277 domain-containing protein [Microcoleus sp. herbarium8]|uniref:DUF4277 domain-containing protein n=1 Tax=Microcoleus sp. herbarium8 TaxID=3055436 RepID=UPI002FD658E9